ncbi:hypothetical protein E4U55_002360 [Claviceps digitariae]|nr:hypothetical protein E4U55_002360 [Claviceps digitariae]
MAGQSSLDYELDFKTKVNRYYGEEGKSLAVQGVLDGIDTIGLITSQETAGQMPQTPHRSVSPKDMHYQVDKKNVTMGSRFTTLETGWWLRQYSLLPKYQ